MMTPVFLNPPSSSFTLVELKDDQHLQLFLSPTHQAASTSTPSSSLHTSQDPRGNILFGEPKQHDHKRAQSYGRLSGQKTTLSSSSFHPANDKTNDVHKFSPIKTPEDKEYEGSCGDGLAKWMPSKMRLMHKMMNSSSSSSTTTEDQPMKFTLKFQDQRYHHHVNESSSSSSNNNNKSNTAAIRVCSDCNTTTTPLWRSGPRGPKSLCNACGIRQRKARRAAAAAAAAAAAENDIVMNMETSPSTSKINKVHANKEKKSRISHVGQSKKLCKPPDSPTRQSQKKLCFKNLALSLSKNSAFQGVFSQDVEEAAILLMELSCGLVHS